MYIVPFDYYAMGSIVRCPNLTLPYFDALFVLLSVTGYELTDKVTPGLLIFNCCVKYLDENM